MKKGKAMDDNDDLYRIDLFIFWRSIVLFFLFLSITALILFYILGLMFLDIFALSFAWGALGIVIGNIWHACKFGFSKRFFRISTYFLIAFISINFLFIPNAIGYLKALNDIKKLDSNDIIAIKVSNHIKTAVKSKSGIAKFAKIAKEAKIFYVNHDQPIKEFKLSIIQKDGQISFPARILKSCPQDIIISIKSYVFWQNIRIPQGAIWLSEFGENRKKNGVTLGG